MLDRIRNAAAAFAGVSGAATSPGAAPRQEPHFRNDLTEYADLPTAVREMVHSSGATADSGVTVNTTTAVRLAAVAACVRVLSRDVAQLPVDLIRRDGDRRDTLDNDPRYRLLARQPNSNDTAFEFRLRGMRDLLLRGAFYGLLSRGLGGRVNEIIRMHPDRVEPRQADDLTISYQYTRQDGRRVTLSRNEVLCVMLDSDDGFRPLTPIAVHRNTFGDGIALQRHGSKFFSNGAQLRGVLQLPGKSDPESRKAMRADFQELYAGLENAHRVAILDQGTTFEPISINNEDAQYIDARKFNRSEIAGIFGVPPHKIGDLERATFSNIEEQNIDYVTGGLLPYLVAWEQAIGRDVLDGEPGLFVKFNVDGLLRGKALERAQTLNIQRRAGIVSANEWRALLDLNPRQDAGGDEYIIEQNMQINDGQRQEGGNGNA